MNAADSLFGRFREFIHRFGLIERGQKIVVAVSGGSDSVVLLDLLDRLKGESNLTLAIAHFNHQLRGADSDGDEAFVRALGGERGLECYVQGANTRSLAESRKLSLEECARDLRYEFFGSLLASLGFEKVATAHQADDNAETILFNLFRGAGVQGLSGIPAWRCDRSVVRPLLFASRQEILIYASERKLLHREDATNGSREHTRNFLRHEVIPLIRENINPNLIATLRRTGELFDQLEGYLGETVGRLMPAMMVRDTPGEVVIDLAAFGLQPAFLREYILLHAARKFASREIEFGTVKTMLRVAGGETGTSCSIAKDAVFYRNRDQLIFSRVKSLAPFRHRVELGKRYDFEQFGFRTEPAGAADLTEDPNTEFIDADTLRGECVLRSWHEGDSFMPLGMREKKKLSDFFIDEKIPLFEKLTIPILVSEGEIVWVCGKRLDDRHKITSGTTRILKLEYTPRHTRPE
jgi:tRNA(Ile)-lysidine synthase